MGNTVSYDTDFYGWTLEQAALLRERRLSEADIENIAEELESMGKSEKRELVNRLAVVLAHLLKWRFQPGLRGASWQNTLSEQRDQLVDHLAENPSLKPLVPSAMATAYRYARKRALAETGLPTATLPDVNPWSENEVLTDDYLPE